MVEAVITRPVQRPHRADACRNFDALVAAARASFAKNGPNASLEDIAKQAGVGIGTLYRNFPTREQLIETIYIDEVEALAAAAASFAELEPKEAFDAFLQRFVEYVGTKRALIEGLNKESPVFNDCRGLMYSAGAPVLERAQAAGAVRDDIEIGDVVRLIASVSSATFTSDEERTRVYRIAVDGLRPLR